MARLYRVVALLLAVSLGVPAAGPSARDLYNRGRKFEKAKDFANAYLMYSQAAAADPSKPEYWRRAQALQRRAAGSVTVAPSGEVSVSESPEPIPPAEPEEVAETRRPEPPLEIKADDSVRSLDLRGDNKTLWEQTAKTWGLDVIFDGDYEAGAQRTLRLNEVGYREALHALMTATNSFIVPMSERLMLVVKDTEQKRREVENTVVLSVPIPEPFTIQEAQELGRTVQQVMEIQRFAIDSAQRMAIFRDRVSKARPAQVLFTQLMTARAQIAVDVELLSAASTSTIGLGMNLQRTFSLTPVRKMMTLNGPFPQLALGIAGANLFARATKSQSRSLYSASMMSADGQPATLRVGEKYPIMTMGFVGNVDPSQGDVYTPPPTFNFEDLGLNIKLTPKVHDKDEVTIEIEAEFKVISGTGTNGIPVISNRRFVSRARLRFDEAAVISGLITRNDFKTLTGPAGIADIPLLGPVLGAALGQADWSKDDIQLLLVMRPRLLTLPPTEYVTHPIWTGTESRPRIPL